VYISIHNTHPQGGVPRPTPSLGQALCPGIRRKAELPSPMPSHSDDYEEMTLPTTLEYKTVPYRTPKTNNIMTPIFIKHFVIYEKCL